MTSFVKDLPAIDLRQWPDKRRRPSTGSDKKLIITNPHIKPCQLAISAFYNIAAIRYNTLESDTYFYIPTVSSNQNSAHLFFSLRRISLNDPHNTNNNQQKNPPQQPLNFRS